MTRPQLAHQFGQSLAGPAFESEDDFAQQTVVRPQPRGAGKEESHVSANRATLAEIYEGTDRARAARAGGKRIGDQFLMAIVAKRRDIGRQLSPTQPASVGKQDVEQTLSNRAAELDQLGQHGWIEFRVRKLPAWRSATVDSSRAGIESTQSSPRILTNSATKPSTSRANPRTPPLLYSLLSIFS